MTTVTRTPDTTLAAATARAFTRAVVDADVDVLRSLLTEDVWFRSLLPRGAVEHHDRDSALATIVCWFAGSVETRVEALYHHASGLRDHVGWRLLLRPEWAPDTWHLIEQIGFVRTDGDRIRRVDLVCTGFQPQA